ncbi:hypothetical protein [Paenibacillus antibioticophila]|uniref:hypothetical protein n=1 Tax=Paenibacillus antibioticophila TaxID=1274374 RepID=UPI0005C9AE99|nr:hypothetical protein [Paenibacillus antibioticophila]
MKTMNTWSRNGALSKIRDNYISVFVEMENLEIQKNTARDMEGWYRKSEVHPLGILWVSNIAAER